MKFKETVGDTYDYFYERYGDKEIALRLTEEFYEK